MGLRMMIISPEGQIYLLNLKVRYRNGFLNNHCLSRSQGTCEQLNISPTRPMSVRLVDWKRIPRLSFSYGASVVHPTNGRLKLFRLKDDIFHY